MGYMKLYKMAKVVVFRDSAFASMLGVSCRETVNTEEVVAVPFSGDVDRELLSFGGRFLLVEVDETNLTYMVHQGGFPEEFWRLLLQCDTFVASTPGTAQFFSSVFHKRGVYCPLPLYRSLAVAWDGEVDILYLGSANDATSVLGSCFRKRFPDKSFTTLSRSPPVTGDASYRWEDTIPKPRVVIYMPYLPCAGVDYVGTFLREGIPVIGTPLRMHYECPSLEAVPWLKYPNAEPIVRRLLEDVTFYEYYASLVSGWMNRFSEVHSWFHLL